MKFSIGASNRAGAGGRGFVQNRGHTRSGVTCPQSCTVSVTFKPTRAEPRSANLTLLDADGDKMQIVPLRGKGVL
jgi:hypothetical protein